MEIRKLTAAQWVSVIDTFQDVFDSDLPNFDHATIYGAYDDGKLKGFILLESVLLVGQIYVKPNENNGLIAKKLVSFVREVIPPKQAVAAVASEPRFEMLFRTLGLEKITGTLFRRNSK